MTFCDLHTHSTASDGTDSPHALAGLAHQAGLAALALTDHDTTAGLSACAQACAELGVAFVPGIEVSADPAALAADLLALGDSPSKLGTLHILGYFVREDDSKLAAVCQAMEQARNQRNPAIVARLQELGVSIEYDEVLELAQREGTGIIGRPHIAQVLLQKGYVKSVQDAFRRYIGQGAPAYVRRDRLHPAEAIDAIHHAGGLAVLAHPIQLGLHQAGQLDVYLTRLKDIGLDGVETRHSDHPPAYAEQVHRIARKLDLLTTGGSDYHGSRKAVALNSQQVPVDVYHALLAMREKA